MGGGNAQKTAKSKAIHLAKEQSKSSGGGGKEGMAKRSGADMGSAMEKAKAEREAVKAKRAEKEAKAKGGK
jgi:hypothetical protein